eukprot:836324-Rhodomonas_salina.1
MTPSVSAFGNNAAGTRVGRVHVAQDDEILIGQGRYTIGVKVGDSVGGLAGACNTSVRHNFTRSGGALILEDAFSRDTAGAERCGECSEYNQLSEPQIAVLSR